MFPNFLRAWILPRSDVENTLAALDKLQRNMESRIDWLEGYSKELEAQIRSKDELITMLVRGQGEVK
jgi:hypothetical protein